MMTRIVRAAVFALSWVLGSFLVATSPYWASSALYGGGLAASIALDRSFIGWFLLALLSTFLVVGSVCDWFGLGWFLQRKGDRCVPNAVESAIRAELESEYEGAIVDDDGKIVRRVGVAMVIAKEVKIKFGGTPKYNEANRLLAARYIDDALIEAGVRKYDRARIFCRIRALVFTKLAEEREEDQWINSRTLCEEHDAGSGWYGEGTLFGGLNRTYRRCAGSA